MHFINRIILLNLLILLSYGSLSAQASLSIKVFPAFTANRVESESDTLVMNDDGSGLRMGFGVIADFPLTERYYFSTGVSYISKKTGLRVLNTNDQNAFIEVTNVRYLQIPLSLKLYTDELTLDGRFFFQIGMLAEFKVGQNEQEGGGQFIQDYNFFDTALLFGIGGEKKIGTNTAVYAGMSYQRGLINIIDETVRFDDDVTMKNSLFALEVGIRF